MRKIIAIPAVLFLVFSLAKFASAQQQTPPPPPKTTASAPQSKTLNGQEKQPPKIVQHVRLIRLLASVVDRRDKFITDLNQNDFEVFEDGHRQPITFFTRETNLPLRIGLLMDTSNSIRERLHFEKDAAMDFLFNVIRHGRDLAFVMTFDNEPEVVQDFTDDTSQLSQVIQQQNSGGGTALNDAIYAASQKLMTAPPASGPDPDVRRIIVVISDGDDNLSDHAVSDAIQMADRAGVSIYAISSNNDWVTTDTPVPEKLHKSEGEQILQEFADETGGRAFYPYRVDDLAQSFLDIGTELRSQYLIGYPPSYEQANGQFHQVQLRVDRKGLTVRSRRGYFAIAPVAETAPATSGSSQPHPN